MKVIEILYSEFSNMYGEIYNPMFLEKNCGDIKLVYTKLNEVPYFVNNNVDMVYMGNYRDIKIYDILNELKKYKDKIKEMIENNIIFLLTGNALELFGSYIKENNNEIEGLNIFDYYIEKDFNKKYASWVRGNFKDIEIIGHRNQFSKCFNIKNEFIKVLNGTGSDIESNIEGINYKNFYATYLLGPFLVMNPLFAKYILNLLGINEMKYEKCSLEAYNKRMEYFHKEDARYIMADQG